MGEIENEVAEMEAKAAEMTKELNTLDAELANFEGANKEYSREKAVNLKLEKLKKTTKAKEKKFKMLEGLLLWSPVTVNGSTIIVNFNGVLKETEASIGFDLANPDGIAAQMTNGHTKLSGAKKAARRPNFSKDAKMYAKAKMTDLLEYVNNELVVMNGSEISEIIQVSSARGTGGMLDSSVMIYTVQQPLQYYVTGRSGDQRYA